MPINEYWLVPDNRQKVVIIRLRLYAWHNKNDTMRL